MNKTILAVLLTLVASLFPAVAHANGYSVPNVNPRDLGLAGSAVAAQGDAAATFANPAALSKLAPGLHLSFGASMLDLASTWTAPDGGASVDSEFNPVPPPALFAAWGGKALGRGWAVGAGLNIPAGGAVKWPTGWEGRTHILTVDRKVYAGYLTAGVEVLPWLRLGGGAVYYHTTEKLSQVIDYVGSEGVAELATAGGAMSYDVSAEIAVPFAPIPVTFAIDYKHKAHQTLEGEAHFGDVPPELEPSLPDQDATHALVFPNTLNVGVAVRPTERLLVTAGYTYDRYQVYTEDRFVGDLGTEVVVDRQYDDGQTFRLGAEYQATKRLQVRAGILRDLSGLREDTFSPSLPDGNTWAGSVGASFALRPNLGLHGALFVAPFDEVTADPTADNFQGSYETRATIFALGLTWSPKFGE
jgi:long-chain fatty acid transport protein